MKILLIGATGYIGSAILDYLVHNGHQVVALMRTPRQLPTGVEMRLADLAQPETVGPAITPDVDAVIHAGAPIGNWDLEDAAVSAVLHRLADPGKPFIYLSGIWVLGPSRSDQGVGSAALDESSPTKPITIVSGREKLESTVLSTNSARGVVVRPGIVHGRGGGIPALLTSWAQERGHGRYVDMVDDGTWPMVDVDELAELVHLAVLSARSGQILHAVAEPAVPVRDIAVAADLAVGGSGRAHRWAFDEAAATLGEPFAEALATSQYAIAPAAAALGWRPRRPGVISDLREGSYQRSPAPAGC